MVERLRDYTREFKRDCVERRTERGCFSRGREVFAVLSKMANSSAFCNGERERPGFVIWHCSGHLSDKEHYGRADQLTEIWPLRGRAKFL